MEGCNIRKNNGDCRSRKAPWVGSGIFRTWTMSSTDINGYLGIPDRMTTRMEGKEGNLLQEVYSHRLVEKNRCDRLGGAWSSFAWIAKVETVNSPTRTESCRSSHETYMYLPIPSYFQRHPLDSARDAFQPFQNTRSLSYGRTGSLCLCYSPSKPVLSSRLSLGLPLNAKDHVTPAKISSSSKIMTSEKASIY